MIEKATTDFVISAIYTGCEFWVFKFYWIAYDGEILLGYEMFY